MHPVRTARHQSTSGAGILIQPLAIDAPNLTAPPGAIRATWLRRLFARAGRVVGLNIPIGRALLENVLGGREVEILVFAREARILIDGHETWLVRSPVDGTFAPREIPHLHLPRPGLGRRAVG